MTQIILTTLYKNIYGENFSSTEFTKRMKMQKAIYLMQEAGISAGDYDFFWYKHGPYSQALQDDILTIQDYKEADISFSEDAMRIITKLHDLLNKTVDYDQSEWAECLASIQYLRDNVFSFNAKNKEIIDELERRKPHLNKHQLNLEALEDLKKLYA